MVRFLIDVANVAYLQIDARSMHSFYLLQDRSKYLGIALFRRKKKNPR